MDTFCAFGTVEQAEQPNYLAEGRIPFVTIVTIVGSVSLSFSAVGRYSYVTPFLAFLPLLENKEETAWAVKPH
eukprot:1147006-Pelagomonas_calceolata.AAC.1